MLFTDPDIAARFVALDIKGKGHLVLRNIDSPLILLGLLAIAEAAGSNTSSSTQRKSGPAATP